MTKNTLRINRVLKRIGAELQSTRARLALGAAIVIGLIAAYWILKATGTLDEICDCQTLHAHIVHLGVFGPLAIIGLMAAAIVVSPIPSAPIAIASGLAYGHIWGTLYIVIGAEIGAITAFSIGRMVGYDILHRWFGERLSMGLLGSQWSLMLIVLLGRLLPFISFDILSYAAGLTPLRFWRFALVTLLGVIPVSFLLAHFGEEFGSTDMTRMTVAVLALGGVTLIPVVVKWLRIRRKRDQGINEKNSQQ
ncbi:hypothetical protein U27_01464 [Candidatus Vecturithrix granuli]|uniref:TVP38/TMEM64 family membrane protein n=1 Tax=Vecturithrix granuli TaxID=1499967 RepID=A0A081CAF8_VECG1|nr:hypothetical protein U27_01464 [Candidatus Vecturithrix granuli]